jgi:hypothetical protein
LIGAETTMIRRELLNHSIEAVQLVFIQFEAADAWRENAGPRARHIKIGA